MGWGYGIDETGKEVGYSVVAFCEQEGCDAPIDRGLAYACGGMHGEDVDFCNGYFCSDHLYFALNRRGFGCASCVAAIEEEE